MNELRWERFVRARDGIASAADLHALGLTDIDIRLHATYGRITRVRRGWYALRDVEPLVVHASRLGGRRTSPGGRGAVTLAAARRQAIACQPW